MDTASPEHLPVRVERIPYELCTLEQFWRHLKRREIYAEASTRWRNPQAQLLEGAAWEAIRSDVLTALGLPGDPDGLLAEHARTLDTAYREVAGRLVVNTEVRVDDAGKIHLSGVKAVEEPPSLVDLRNRTTAMLPRVDLPEVLLEVMAWVPGLAEAFTAVSGGRVGAGERDLGVAGPGPTAGVQEAPAPRRHRRGPGRDGMEARCLRQQRPPGGVGGPGRVRYLRSDKQRL